MCVGCADARDERLLPRNKLAVGIRGASLVDPSCESHPECLYLLYPELVSQGILLTLLSSS